MRLTVQQHTLIQSRVGFGTHCTKSCQQYDLDGVAHLAGTRALVKTQYTTATDGAPLRILKRSVAPTHWALNDVASAA